jgi:hypothetical protein
MTVRMSLKGFKQYVVTMTCYARSASASNGISIHGKGFLRYSPTYPSPVSVLCDPNAPSFVGKAV